MKPLPSISKSIRMGILIAGIVGVVTGLLAWYQVQREREIDLDDIDRRAHALAHQFSFTVRETLGRSNEAARNVLGSRIEGYGRLIGFAVYRGNGELLAAAKAASEYADVLESIVKKAVATRTEIIEIADFHGPLIHVLAVPVNHNGSPPAGVLAVLHDVSYIDERTTGRLIQFAFWIGLVTLLLVTVVIGVAWMAYERPLQNLADWMRRLRLENVPEAPPRGLPIALLESESDRLAASFRAARSAVRAHSRAEVQTDRVWTRDRLRAHALDCLRGGQLIVVSNREPYMHQLRGGKPQVIVPAGGLVTALDPVLQACGGVWVAHGGGDADRQTADAHGRLTVPPGDARYTLRRVWLPREEEQGYYYGFSNEGLWPLCHLVHERPIFRTADWQHYVSANRRFAQAALAEAGDGPAVVLVQDYHLALVPQFIKAARPDFCVGIFWHIPWPNPEAFRICPWRVEILHGMLGADLVGFHLQQYGNNFLDAVDRMMETRLDWDHFAVELKGHTSLVRPFPISVESWSERPVPKGKELVRQIAEIQEQYKLEDAGTIAVGVDRVDYTKGLPERLRAVARFLEKYRQHRGKFTFVQLGAPSRTHLRRYRDLITDLESMADEINWRFQTDSWKPIRLLLTHHDAAAVHAFLAMASIGIVSSLHDGMNLVAKEFVAAREDNDGVLVLSEFAGAARELSDALVINPYDTEQFADAIGYAMEMEPGERRLRMERMRQLVEEHNIYWWAAGFLTELCATRAPSSPLYEAASAEA